MDRWAAILLLIFVSGCTWQSDSGAPTIFTHTPSQGASFSSGDTIDFEMTTVDDWALMSASFELVPAFDTLWDESRTLPAWRLHDDTTFEGNTFFWNGQWVIPDSVAEGTYSLKWQSRDAKGKLQTEDLTFKIISSLDSMAPVIDSFYVEDTLSVGQNWELYLSAGDDLSLSYGILQLMQDGSEVWRQDITVMDSVWVVDTTLTYPGMVGRYDLKLTVRDWVNKLRSQTVGFVFE